MVVPEAHKSEEREAGSSRPGHRNGAWGCVEVARAPGTGIAVRDSNDPDGPRLAFTGGD